MSRPYGKPPARGGRKKPDAPQATEIQVNITGRHTIEQLSLEVQRAIAMVQDYGAVGLEKFRFRLLPLDNNGQAMVLRDELGAQVQTINIPDEPTQPVYRENEPGVGIMQQETSPARSTRHTPRR